MFFPDPVSGRLQMRYTARTRSIKWRDDDVTPAASDWLRNWLQAEENWTVDRQLAQGQGVICNNILHNRTGFEDSEEPEKARVVLRIRFHQRIAED